MQALASLTRLTALDLSGYAASSPGWLQHLTSLASLRSLTLSNMYISDQLQHLSALANLTMLRVSAQRGSLQSSGLARLSSLQHLDIHGCSSRDIRMDDVAQLTRLTHLDISCWDALAAPARLEQLMPLTNLRTLYMWGHSIGEQSAALLGLPHLCELRADDVAAQPGQDLNRCAITRLVLARAAHLPPLPPLPALQSLTIGTAHAGIASLAQQTQLTELVVAEFQEQVQPADLAAALQGLRQLQVLLLYDAPCFDRRCLEAVGEMPQLQKLWLCQSDGSQAAPQPVGGCLEVLRGCPKLQRVLLEGCGPISKPSLEALVTHRPMQTLELCGRQGLTVAAVPEVQAVGARHGCRLVEEQPSPPAAACARLQQRLRLRTAWERIGPAALAAIAVVLAALAMMMQRWGR